MLDEIQIRQEKLERLKAVGLDPYPNETGRDAKCGEALDNFEAWSTAAKQITLAGRLMTVRVHGGMMFADLVDDSGKIQIAFKEDELEGKTFENFRDLMDPGDFVEATGTLFVTKRGEKTLSVKTWKPLAKALMPLPEKWHGLQDVEARYRERELDLIANPEVRERFILRSHILSEMRRFLDDHGFMEVETPVLNPIAGGANARPFVTHHNALDVDFYLRIAPELYLKRLVVGGFEKVYEVARCFRNEGIDHAHNPEFTQIEFYWAMAGKERFLSFLEELLTKVVGKWQAPFPRMTFKSAIADATGIDIDKLKTRDEVEKAAKKKKLEIDFSRCVGVAECYDELFKKAARAKISGPAWVLDYPLEMIPLAGASPKDPTKAAIAQLIIEGQEVIKAFYYEQQDPSQQRAAFEAQQSLAEQGSEEAQHLDESFLRALEHGMPPTSGAGIGIDRLVSLVTGVNNLKEVILFPTLRPEK